MPTFAVSVMKHHKRKDGKYPVSIRVTHNRKSAYISTGLYVSRKQVDKKFNISDLFLLKSVLERVEKYEKIVLQASSEFLDVSSAKEMVKYVEAVRSADKRIDFLGFGREISASMIKAGQASRGKHVATTLNSIEDFMHGKPLFMHEINSVFLRDYESFLRSEREMTRRASSNKMVISKRLPVSDTGVRGYMTNIKLLFHKAMDKYNDEDGEIVIIKNYPFRKYKMPGVNPTKNRSLEVDVIKKILFLPDNDDHARNFGRDVFALSFFLVGMNTVDLFHVLKDCARDGRLSYSRSKTMGRRSDLALISVKIEPEVLALMEKYAGSSRLFRFFDLYSSASIFGAAVNKGLARIAKELGITSGLTSYYARHSWATIARNQLDVSLDDIALCLNHVSNEHRITETYVKRDFSRIDGINRRMIDLIMGKNPDSTPTSP
jgi:integrase